MNYICYNGSLLPEDEPLFTSKNRSFRYGDGLFETIKVYDGRILFEEYHFERLFLGLKMLQIQHSFPSAQLSSNIIELCKKNKCLQLARVRLAVFRNDQNAAEYTIEAFPLSSDVNQWNEKGLTIGIYPYARKSTDALSNLKTANFLPYVLAELYAKENKLDDAVVLNAFNNVCDTSKANIFLIRKKNIYTPALHQGCINGVMRRFLIDELKKRGYKIHQDEISEQDLHEADEVFLTNSIYDLRWVHSFKGKQYSNEQTSVIYQDIIKPLYQFLFH